MFDLHQTPEAKADAKTIAKHVDAISNKRFGYNHYIVDVELKERPDGWDDSRIGHALVDYVDGGWSPFGGWAETLDGTRFSVRVSID